MIDGAIGANEASQAQQNDDFRQNQAQSNKENDLAKLSFVELGNKLRNAMDEAQRASAKARSDAITNARAAESMAQRDSRLSAESNLEN